MLFKLPATEKPSGKSTSLAFSSFKSINSSRNLINGRIPNAYPPVAVELP